MAKRKGSVPPPEAPPTKSPSLNSPTAGGASTLAADPSLPAPLTNGVVPHGDEKLITPPGKQKRQFRLTRAFTSGTLKVGKPKKKTKTASKDDSEIETPVVAVDVPKRRGVIGGISEDSEDVWKLPGIADLSKVKLKSPKLKASSVSDSSLLGRELPPVPDHDEATTADPREQFGKRELPPLPSPAEEDASHMQSASPSPPSIGTRYDQQDPVSAAITNGGDCISSKEVTPTGDSDDTNPMYVNTLPFLAGSEDDMGPTYVNTTSLKDVNINGINPSIHAAPICNGSTEEVLAQIAQLPELPPGTEDLDSSCIHPLPKTSPNDEELGPSSVTSDVPMEQQNGLEHNQETITGNETAKDEGDANSGTLSVSDSSSLSPADQPTSQEVQEEVRDYTIGDVITTYSYALPVRMRILQGYCSDTTDVNISTEDIYELHSVQHMRNAIFKDEDGMMHRVSVKAPVKVGLIYNPKNDYDSSLDGYTYKTISEVTSLPVLPKVIAATKGVKCGEEKNSVSEGEVFVVKQVQRSSMFKVKKGLRVYSLSTKSDKVLLDDCSGHFSTKPSLVRMDLPELLGEVTDIYPSRCVLYPTTDDAAHKSDFPGTLSRVATLTECTTDTVLVVSDVSWMDEQGLEEANLLPIPRTSPNSFELLLEGDIANLVEVAVLKWTYPEEEEVGGEDVMEGKEAGGDLGEDPELNHLYDDTTDLGLSSNEDLSGSQGHLGSAGRLQASLTGKEPTYMNLQQQKQQQQQQQPQQQQQQQHPQQQQQQKQQQEPSVFNLSLENLKEKEQKFFEEDEDAGYDTVGLHLIGAKKPLGSSAPLPVSDPVETTPFPNHGYSRVNINRGSKKTPPLSRDGYSTVAMHSTMNGIVTEVMADSDKPLEEGGTDGGVAKGKESQLSSMIESLESRFKSLEDSQQSAEITKVQSMLEKLTAKLETVDSQLTTLSAPPSKAAKDTKGAKQEEEVGNGRSTADCNRDYLKALDEQQVAKLMVAMSLGQYCDKILSEHISGEILMECDDAILEEEIGVASRIHRIRIMKLISGQHSAKSLLEKE